jgi:hypothetical protein
MGLTRPTVAQLNTVVTEISDPISVLNKGSTLANVDVGFVFNRDSGASPNVALYWNETLDSLVIAYTNSTGGVNSNIAVSSYANLTVGNITSSGNISAQYITGSGQFLTGLPASYSNVNVKAYTETMGYTNYSNVNLIAYLAGGITSTGFINTSANVSAAQINSATAVVTGSAFFGELFVKSPGGDEGGQLNLAPAVTNTTLAGNVVIDVFQNKLRIFEGGGTARGGFFDIAGLAAGVGTNLAGGGGTPGGGQGQLQFNSSSAFAGAASLYYFGANGAIVANAGIASTSTTTGTMQITGGIGVSGNVWADQIYAVNNGNGQNIRIGDDAWLGDINTADTLQISGAQNSNNGYLRFGNVGTETLGRAGAGTLIWTGGFRVYGNLTVDANLTITGSILPSANVTYDLGSPTQRFRSAYFSGNTVYIGPESISVSNDGTWTFTSNGGNATMSSSSAMGNIYMDKTTGFMGFNDTSPDYVYDFYTPDNAGEILHIEGGVGTQAFFGARNSSGLNYAAGADQNYAFSGTIDTTNDYALKTNNIVRANIQGSSGNVIFTESITVAKDILATTFGIEEIRGTASNITVRSNITLLGTNLIGAGQLVIGTENLGEEALFVTGATYLDGDVTVSGNLFVNGNVTYISSNNVSISDSMIYLAEDNPADTLDIGFVSAFTDAVGYQHTGFVRDATDGVWKLFANVAADIEAEPTTTIDFTGASYANLLVGNITATYFTGNGAFLTGLPAGYSNVQVATYLPGYGGTISVASATTAIANGGTNGQGNIGASGATFNTVFAKATTAQYADLAEVYTSDQQYPAGTVVIFGGEAEVTQSCNSHDTRIAGVVSTDPAYLMNSTATGIPVALQGRVPCRVLGPLEQGDRVVSSHIPGVAQRLDLELYQPGCIIGKALQAVDSTDISIIEVVVGRV